MGANNQSDEWSGHPPFTAEDGGSEPKHGLYQDPDTFFESNPDAREMRDDLIEQLLDDCAHPERQEHIVERYATLFVKLEWCHRNLGGVSDESAWDRLGALETKTQRWYDRIDWQEEEDRADKKADSSGFFEALSSNEETKETLFDP